MTIDPAEHWFYGLSAPWIPENQQIEGCSKSEDNIMKTNYGGRGKLDKDFMPRSWQEYELVNQMSQQYSPCYIDQIVVFYENYRESDQKKEEQEQPAMS